MQDTTPVQKAWIALLNQAMENEAAIGRLYARYAELFPAQSDTWTILARAEAVHTSSLRELLQGEAPSVEEIPLEKLQAGTLAFVSGQITVMLEKAAAGDVTEGRATANALLLESSLVESFLFAAAPPVDSPFRRVAEQLYRESQVHRQIVLGIASPAQAAPAEPLWRGEMVVTPPETPSRISAALTKQTVIAGLVRHEETVAKLYGRYAVVFPEMKTFWGSLACDEIEHAKVLRHIGRQIEEGALDFSGARLTLDTIRTSQEFIENHIDAARRDPIGSSAALATAIAVEEKSIECQAFHVFTDETASPELRAAFAELRKHELQHRETIAAKLAETEAKPETKGFFRRLFGRG